MTIWLPEITDKRGPKYLAIADALAEDIRSGKLTVGSKLPTQRELAYGLGLNLNTVSRAFSEAEKRGLISGEVGRGTFVKMGAPRSRFDWPHESQKQEKFNFGPNFPIKAADDKLVKQTLERLGKRKGISDLFHYQPEGFHPAHQMAGAQWLGVLGLDVHAEDVIVTCGALHSVFLAVFAQTKPGDAVLVEELTSPAIKGICTKLGLRMLPVAMDDEGIRPDRLRDVLEKNKAGLLITMPTMHNPTTATMSLERRERILEIVREFGVVVVEDDVYRRLWNDPPPTLASLSPNNVCYCTSFSKIAAPGLRIGYLTLPLPLKSRAMEALRITTWMAPPVMAQIASEWVTDGTLELLIQTQVTETRRRQAIAREVLEGIPMSAHPSGHHCWLHLPDPWRASELALILEKKGVYVTPAENFSVGRGTFQHCIRVCLGAAENDSELVGGLRLIASTIQEAPSATGHFF